MFPFQDDNPVSRLPLATYLIIAVNALAFLWSAGLSEQQLYLLHFERGFVPARIGQLTDPRPLQVKIQGMVEDRFGRPREVAPNLTLLPDRQQILLSLLTCMFLHGGWMHLLGNMWFLWIFGDNVEDRLGAVRYLGLYLLGGLAATATHWFQDPSSTIPVIGASGAVAAVLGAYAITWPHARVHTLVVLVVFVTIIDLPALLVLGVWFGAQVLSGMQPVEAGEVAGVAWWAHVGGFLAGMILMPLLKATTPPRRQYEDRPW
ncbi:MAG: rhomboid family intramembrane serine protease [Planctomycetota bacterium]